MKTPDIIITHPGNEDKFEALKAVLKALKIKFEIPNTKKTRFLKELKQAVDEVNLIKAGKKKAKPLSEFLNEL